eukprot:292264-Alexandrium_andersonii.AAC.1
MPHLGLTCPISCSFRCVRMNVNCRCWKRPESEKVRQHPAGGYGGAGQPSGAPSAAATGPPLP